MDVGLSRVLAGIVLLSAAVTAASPAFAGDWPPPVEGGAQVLAFGARYAESVHRGVDLAADAGVDVIAPVAGVVVFAGQVPADGGGTCGAVTILTADGSRVSLLPLETTVVASGDSLVAGAVVGSLATVGDDSVPGPHLHLSLRSGDLYIDPASFLAAASAAPDPVSGETSSEVAGQSASDVWGGSALPSTPDAPPVAVVPASTDVYREPDAAPAPHQFSGSAIALSTLTDADVPNSIRPATVGDPVTTAPQAPHLVTGRIPVEGAGVSRTASLEAPGSGAVSNPAPIEAPATQGGATVGVVVLLVVLSGAAGRLSVAVLGRHEGSSGVSERWGRPRCGAVESLVHFGSFISCSGQRLQKSRGRFSPREVNC